MHHVDVWSEGFQGPNESRGLQLRRRPFLLVLQQGPRRVGDDLLSFVVCLEHDGT